MKEWRLQNSLAWRLQVHDGRRAPQSYALFSVSTNNTHIQIALNHECSCMSAAWLWCDVMMSGACALVTPKYFLVQWHMWPYDNSSAPLRQSYRLRCIKQKKEQGRQFLHRKWNFFGYLFNVKVTLITISIIMFNKNI